ncbi:MULTISPECIES: ketopantoate reductase family protein [Micromonospora]|uniref:Ketopantoate reductase family protein n=1 Tax=Micromonospora solifontis TaxID=2487138 RepID=A0ABX9WLC8_9ACTN|nr:MULTISPECIES: 2-dehydropantoate 2-reductase N-terminal domain-containing protein [Micromonospora]NES14350.1 ketopantoate reductase family protein [Micromonospora sp. PPF5-17B]NES35042.1 ketopantoate reductase family protein [Micromonospora solifontis]NES57458.1 ketopantoate reductase family protein [Micromonospora sp. PPF5-6]RNM01313.1 ketopantoate reductase family protein [Micromonospora solifontis]
MRYLIIGAGAVGGTIGVRMGEAGRDVTLVARGAQLAALQERSLTLRTPDGTVTTRLPAVAGPGEQPLPADTVLVLTVKSQDTGAALGTWVDAPVEGGGTAGERLPIVLAQNGVANERAALRLFARVHPVCVWLPATHLEPGVVVANGHPHPGMLHLGRYPSGSDDTSRAVAADLTAAGFVVPVREDVMRWKYGKLLGNLGNGLQALLGRDIPEPLAARVRAEGEAALAAAGIAHTTPEEEAAERGDRVRHRPVDGEERAGGSTWQSLARGTGSAEADHLNGEIVLLGRLHGVPTPVNAAVQAAVRRAVRERIPAGGFPVGELEKMVG